MDRLRLGLAALVLLTPSDGAVEVRTFRFRDPVIEVVAGGAVRWSNRDQITHRVTSGRPGQPDSLFSGSLDRAGSTFVHRFDRPGRYPYFCARHRFMLGEVRVLTHTEGAR